MNTSSDIRTFIVNAESSGTRLDVFLAEYTGLSRSQIKNLISGGHSEIENGKPPKPSYQVEAGDIIKIAIPELEEPNFLPENIPLDIVYEDNHIAVVNKPSGMVVHPGRGNVSGTMASGLLYHFKSLSEVGEKFRPGIIHRIDMDTSGLLVVALSIYTHGILSKMIQKREIKRMYTAVVWGHPDPEEGTIDAPIGRHPVKGILRAVIPSGRNAVTHYKLTERFEFLSKLSITLETGRTHQIRVHLAHIGHHVFGDPNYGGREERLKGFSPEIRLTAKKLLTIIDRQALHAERLEFMHPVTGQELSFKAPIPDDMSKLLTALGK
ncbi:RluA family pseudouridine synthase [Candidatus Latescibacterota bacterium]